MYVPRNERASRIREDEGIQFVYMHILGWKLKEIVGVPKFGIATQRNRGCCILISNFTFLLYLVLSGKKKKHYNRNGVRGSLFISRRLRNLYNHLLFDSSLDPKSDNIISSFFKIVNLF